MSQDFFVCVKNFSLLRFNPALQACHALLINMFIEYNDASGPRSRLAAFHNIVTSLVAHQN